MAASLLGSAFLAAVLAAACAAGPVVVRGPGDVKGALGQRVRVEGTARDAKLGAAVIGADGLVVFCLDVARWPAEVEGRRVVAEGTLEETSEPQAAVGPGGERSAGIEGSAYVLRRTTWQALP